MTIAMASVYLRALPPPHSVLGSPLQITVDPLRVTRFAVEALTVSAARTGQTEKDWQNRTARTGHAKIFRSGQATQDRQSGTDRM
jgi:hypothetical protein